MKFLTIFKYNEILQFLIIKTVDYKYVIVIFEKNIEVFEKPINKESIVFNFNVP
jgi:hypothetical protein